MTTTAAPLYLRLTGPDETGDLPRAITPPGQGGKFAPDGQVLPFPGNTVVCHIPPGSKAHEGLIALQNRAKSMPWAKHFTFLPPSSFHMTVFEGVCINHGFRNFWPEGVGQDLGRDEISRIMLARLEGLSLPPRNRVAPIGLRHNAGLGIEVTGATPAEEAVLRDCRTMLRDRLQLFPPSFADYRFHVTLAYLLHWVDNETAQEIGRDVLKLLDIFRADVPVIDLGPPEFCNFEDMCAFHPQRVLSD